MKWTVSLREVVVGSLFFDGKEFSFLYSQEYQALSFPTLLGFPEKDQVYKSPTLFTFFNSRVPSKYRIYDSPLEQVRLLNKYGPRVVVNPYVVSGIFQ